MLGKYSPWAGPRHHGVNFRNTGYSQKNGAVLKVNVHRQQQQLSKFLIFYQQFASHAYCGAAEPVSKMASQQEKAFCVLSFEVFRSVITVQREFCARFRTAGSAKRYQLPHFEETKCFFFIFKFFVFKIMLVVVNHSL
jgi:hypothetical protein